MKVKHILLKIAAGGLLLLAPAIAEAAQGVSTANVNMRAGPSTRYPAVAVIPNGTPLEIRGCLADTPKDEPHRRLQTRPLKRQHFLRRFNGNDAIVPNDQQDRNANVA